MNIKYRPVKAFLLAVDSGSFTHAAAQLGVTQPSFTALIQDLEATLGVRLFERSTRSIALSESGHDFLARIQRPLADIEEAYKSVLDLSASNRGTVTLGALPSTAFALVPPALETLQAAHPGLTARVIEAHHDQLLRMLRTNQVECVLATMLEPAPDLVFDPLMSDVYCAVFPVDHPLAQKRRLVWGNLATHKLILLAQGSSARAQFDRARLRKASGTPLQPQYDVTHIITAVAMARRGLGVAVVPRLSLLELELGGLCCLAISSASSFRTVGMLYRRDRALGPATTRFIEHLHAAVPDVQRRLLPFDNGRHAKT